MLTEADEIAGIIFETYRTGGIAICTLDQARFIVTRHCPGEDPRGQLVDNIAEALLSLARAPAGSCPTIEEAEEAERQAAYHCPPPMGVDTWPDDPLGDWHGRNE